jgi:hypothetical protein
MSEDARRVIVFCMPFGDHVFAHSAGRRFDRGRNVIVPVPIDPDEFEAADEDEEIPEEVYITASEIEEIRNDPGHRFDVTEYDREGKEIPRPERKKALKKKVK